LIEDRVERRLAAVMAADIAGYSRLMGRDEEGTLFQLKSFRKAVVDPAIFQHRGRIVKTTGDGVLAEFASAVDAARCAVEVQRGIAERNSGVPQEQRIEFRIGIHVGDIIIDENDIFGDGVNIAARLEGLAQPGGVCISDDAYRQIRGKVDIAFEDMGSQSLKNISEPMRAWSLRLDANTPSPEKPSTASVQPLALPDKPSIAVLPFQNRSGDVEQEYFADGMVEDIITGLSRSKSLFVIARNSSFTYKGKAVDIKQVGRELGVRYVLEGSVRKSGKRVRITGQLIDASSGNHIWADRFESELEDIFDLQDRVTGSVIGAISPQLERAEMERAQRKPTENLQAYDYYFRALSSYYRYMREPNVEALQLSRMACTLDPGFALPHALVCTILSQRKQFGWSTDPDWEREEAIRMGRRAIELDQDDPLVLAIAGQTLTVLAGELEDAGALLTRSIHLDPNLASARYWSGMNELFLGNVDVAIEQFQTALRLSPLDPRIFLAQNGLAQANFLIGRYEEGLFWATTAIRRQPNFIFAYRTAMSCHAMMGQLADAQRMYARATQIDPDLRISGIRDRTPYRRPEDIEKIAHAWRLAGVPE
jgi:TolB-like protein/class 3 adenylate cyclase